MGSKGPIAGAPTTRNKKTTASASARHAAGARATPTTPPVPLSLKFEFFATLALGPLERLPNGLVQMPSRDDLADKVRTLSVQHAGVQSALELQLLSEAKQRTAKVHALKELLVQASVLVSSLEGGVSKSWVDTIRHVLWALTTSVHTLELVEARAKQSPHWRAFQVASFTRNIVYACSDWARDWTPPVGGAAPPSLATIVTAADKLGEASHRIVRRATGRMGVGAPASNPSPPNSEPAEVELRKLQDDVVAKLRSPDRLERCHRLATAMLFFLASPVRDQADDFERFRACLTHAVFACLPSGDIGDQDRIISGNTMGAGAAAIFRGITKTLATDLRCRVAATGKRADGRSPSGESAGWRKLTRSLPDPRAENIQATFLTVLSSLRAQWRSVDIAHLANGLTGSFVDSLGLKANDVFKGKT